VVATTLDLCRTLTVNLHSAIPRCAARSTRALRNDGVEDVAVLALVERHGLDAIRSQTSETREPGYGEYGPPRALYRLYRDALQTSA
jgi:hypothetical protein